MNDLEKEYEERAKREENFRKDFPEGFDQLGKEIEKMKEYGIFCGVCNHGFGCEHGVPAYRLP